MKPLVSCLLPTFGRFPNLARLVNEAVYSFIQQDYERKELILCNDDPTQQLIYEDPQVRVINLPNRFPTLGDKLRWMIQAAQGDYLCRWDDDDISLPWRLSYSMEMISKHLRENREVSKLGNHQWLYPEWRPEQHWYCSGGPNLQLTKHPGNTHIMAVWHRGVLGETPYPGKLCVSGYEDQHFTAALRERDYPYLGDLIPLDKIFYLYRWGTGSNHLSGKGGGDRMEQNYQEIGQAQRGEGRFAITPGWLRDYTQWAARAAMVHSEPHPLPPLVASP